MQISGINCNTYLYEKMPASLFFEGKKKAKKQLDTFEKQKEPYSVENSADDFASDLFELMKRGKCDKDNIRQLTRQYVPRTKIEDNWLKLALCGSSAQFLYGSNVSNNNKLHCPFKKIVVDLQKTENMPNEFFNDFGHEMVHNLQTNKLKKVFNTIYNDYFDDSLVAHRSCWNFFSDGMLHGERMIHENFNKTFGVFKLSERQNFRTEKNKKVDAFVKNPAIRTEIEQFYDLAVLSILTFEEEAYTTADSMELKYFNTKNKRAKKNERLFRNLKKIVEDDLKQTGMSEEKIAEYKELIGR